MKAILCGICLALAGPVLAQTIEVTTEFENLDIEWKPFGDEAPAADQQVESGIQAVTLINRGDVRALCQFIERPEHTGLIPVLVLEPDDQAVLRTPQSAEDNASAVLQCVKG